MNLSVLIRIIGTAVRKLKSQLPEYIVSVILLYVKVRSGFELGKSSVLHKGLPNPVLDPKLFTENSFDVLLENMDGSAIVKAVQEAQANVKLEDLLAEKDAAAEVFM